MIVTADTRPPWDDVWMHMAFAIAARSLCSRAKVGAVITNPDNRVIAVGYNGPPAGFEHDNEPCTSWCPRATNPYVEMGYDDCVALHAEQNTIAVCDQQQRRNGTIYVTSDVCFTCAKLIANAKLARVVVARSLDDDRAYRNSDKSYEFLREMKLRVDLV